MATIWAPTIRNHQMDLAKRAENLTLRVTLQKVQEGKIPGNDKLTYGKAS